MLIPLIALAIVLRCVGLNQQMWYDEIQTLLHSVRNPLSTILTSYSSENQHTLYSLLAHLSTAALGEQPWVLRLPAVLFGVATVPMLYFFGCLLTSTRESLLAAALLSVSYHLIWFSQNARGYTALAFWALLATFLFIQGARQKRLLPWVAYGVVVALGAFTHLTMALVAIGHGLVYLWLLAGRARQLGRLPTNAPGPLLGLGLAAFLTLLAYASVLPYVFAQNVQRPRPPVEFEWANPLWLVLETIRGLSAGIGWGPVVVGSLLFLAGLASYWHQNRYVVGLMVVPAIVTLLAIQLLVFSYPRFVFFAIGFGFLVVVRGTMEWAGLAARWLRRPAQSQERWGMALVVLIMLASLWSLRVAYRYPKQDYLGAMEFVEQTRKGTEPVVTVGLTTAPYRDYYGRKWEPVEDAAQLQQVLARKQPTWLLYTVPAHVKALHPDVWKAIQEDFSVVRVFPGTLGGGDIYVCRAQL